MSDTLQLELPPKLIPVFSGPARYRTSWGGRGSAKTRTFAKMAAVHALRCAQQGIEGIILCCREFMNSLDDSSMAEVKAAIRSEPWLLANFEIGEKFIRTLCGRVSFKFQGLRRNLDSIKSKALILLCWVDEAEPVLDKAWNKLIPTVREDGSEIWVTWNPERKKSATSLRFRNAKDDDIKGAEMNWRDNPWFPKVLEDERRRDLRDRPEEYDHVWEGAYATVIKGAYFAKQITAMIKTGRYCRVAPDPLLPIRTYHDIGGSGARSDAYSIWVVQFVDQEIRILASYEAQGQSLQHHVKWLRWWCELHDFSCCIVQLPHDGVSEGQGVTGKRYMQHWKDASDKDFYFDVPEPIENQGKGAASQRVEAVRGVFPRILMNNAPHPDVEGETWTEAGFEALKHYHEKISDDEREIGLGPDHDWASHSADSFGLMAIDYKPPTKTFGAIEMPMAGVA